MIYIESSHYEAALDWYKAHPDVIRNGYVFSKQCLCAYVKWKVHAQEYISRRIRLNAINPGSTRTGQTDDFNRNTSPKGDAAKGQAVIERIFLNSWNGRWAPAEEMGYPLVAIGSQMFSYMSGQIIYFDYGMSSVWEIGALSKN